LTPGAIQYRLLAFFRLISKEMECESASLPDLGFVFFRSFESREGKASGPVSHNRLNPLLLRGGEAEILSRIARPSLKIGHESGILLMGFFYDRQIPGRPVRMVWK